jgi:hypothetical protein
VVQAAPAARLARQTPASQKKPVWQAASVEHEVAHELPWQTAPPVQARAAADLQTPVGSQVAAGVSVDPEHDPG